MKNKILAVGFFLASCLLLPAPSFAQFTTVTATVKDPNGIPYAGAVLNAILVPSTGGGYTLSGQPYSGRIGPVTLSSTGSFTVNFGDVTLISPGSPQWQITIDSAAATIQGPLGTGPQSFTYTSTGTTISGSSPVSLTTALNALAPALTNITLGSGSVTSVTATSPIVVTPSPITTTGAISCPTCNTSGATIAGTISATHLTQATAANTAGDVAGSVVTTATGAIALTAGADTTSPLQVNSHSSTQSATEVDISNQSSGGGGTGTLAAPLLVEGKGYGAFNPGNSTTVMAIQQESTATAGDALVITNKQAVGSGSRTSTLELGVPDNGIAQISGGNAVGDGSGNYPKLTFDGNPSIYGATSAPGGMGIATLTPAASQVALTIGNINVSPTGDMLDVVNSTGKLSGILVNGCNYYVTNAVTTTNFCGQGVSVIDPLTFGVKADGHAVVDATTSSGSPIVTCPNLDCNFLTTAVVGQRVFANKGFNACTGGSYIIPASTTISSIDSDSQIHVSNNAANNCTATARLVWGDVDQTSAGTGPWQNAWNAFITVLSHGPAFLKIPCAMSLIDAGIGGGAPTHTAYIPTIAGCGPSTSVLATTADYSWTAVSIGANHVQLFGFSTPGSFVAQPYTHDFVVDGSGENTNCPASSQTLLSLANQSYLATNVYANNLCPLRTNLLCFLMGNTSVYINIQSDFCGQPCMSLTAGGQPTNLYQLFCGDSNQGMVVNGTGTVNSYGGSYGQSGGCGQGLPLGNGGAITFNSYGENITETLNLGTGTRFNGYGDLIQGINCGAGNGAITMAGTAAATLQNTTVSPTGTTNNAINGTGTIYVQGDASKISAGTVGIASSTVVLNVNPQTVGSDRQVAKAAAQTAKTVFTVGAQTTLFRVHLSVECTTTSAAATVTPAVLYTDTSGTVQTVTGTAATCTALGASSNTSQDVTFRAQNATAIQYQTTIANTPTYDVSVTVEQLGLN
jgi:hypothetical protein